ncbi:MAG: ABC transporter substrate-binding protein [Tepidisphaeraceae bacterium]
MDRLDDVLREATHLGHSLGLTDESATLVTRLRTELDAVRTRATTRPTVRTLLVIGSEGTSVAGADVFLNDLLTIAGGTNALPAGRTGYSSIDREALLATAPDVILQFMPGATPAELNRAKAVWATLADAPAMKHARIVTITEDWCLMPGARVADLAKRMADELHGR